MSDADWEAFFSDEHWPGAKLGFFFDGYCWEGVFSFWQMK
jgi:hypothetical protein